jgi:FtsZ-binding cell division protein ZapB
MQEHSSSSSSLGAHSDVDELIRYKDAVRICGNEIVSLRHDNAKLRRELGALRERNEALNERSNTDMRRLFELYKSNYDDLSSYPPQRISSLLIQLSEQHVRTSRELHDAVTERDALRQKVSRLTPMKTAFEQLEKAHLAQSSVLQGLQERVRYLVTCAENAPASRGDHGAGAAGGDPVFGDPRGGPSRNRARTAGP